MPTAFTVRTKPSTAYTTRIPNLKGAKPIGLLLTLTYTKAVSTSYTVRTKPSPATGYTVRTKP